VATEARELKMAHKSDSVKRVYVYMDEKQHMDLKIRLDYHNVGMSEFVRACSEALLLGHPIMEQFMDNYKENSEKHSKRNNKIAKRDREKSEKMSSDLGLNLDEIENIFDIIEEDHPEIYWEKRFLLF
jgi:hypothetical protein